MSSIAIDNLKRDLEAAKKTRDEIVGETREAIERGRNAQRRLDDARRDVSQIEEAIRVLEHHQRGGEVEVQS